MVVPVLVQLLLLLLLLLLLERPLPTPLTALLLPLPVATVPLPLAALCRPSPVKAVGVEDEVLKKACMPLGARFAELDSGTVRDPTLGAEAVEEGLAGCNKEGAPCWGPGTAEP